MEHERYLELTQRAAQLVESGERDKAIEILRSLVASDISDRDKAMMCLNLAIVYDQLGLDAEALRWYDQGMRYERGQGQIFVGESKAVYLAQRGDSSGSIRTYEALLRERGLTESDKQRVRENIRLLRERQT